MAQPSTRVPGLSWQVQPAEPPAASHAGRPALIGAIAGGDGVPVLIDGWSRFVGRFGAGNDRFRLAVRGFFANGGGWCFVVPVPERVDAATLTAALAALVDEDDVSLIIAPGVVDPTLQALLVAHCDALADRFAVLDVPEPSLLNADTAVAEAQAHATALRQATGSANVALYAPWLKMVTDDGPVFVPPSGHVAGVYARFAEKRGVHHAPANEPLADVVDLRIDFDDDALATLYPPLALDETGRIADPSVNLIRALPARGLRVWGARTLSAETRWRSIAVRRLVIDIERWLTRRLDGMVFEVNDMRLRSRVIREVGARLDELYLAGALVGAVSELAWSIQCDETNNPADVRLAGLLVADIEIAPAVPGEYITLRLIHRSGTDGSTQTLTS